MPDSLLLMIFGALFFLGLLGGGVSMAMAVRNARKPDGEIRMALWAFVALAGMIMAGMSAAYFLIPIFLNRL